MNAGLLALSHRATRASKWRWIEGMIPLQGFATALSTRLPDLSHPATVGCLIALLREVSNDPFISPECFGAPDGAGVVWHIAPRKSGGPIVYGSTEVEALVKALEAAN